MSATTRPPITKRIRSSFDFDVKRRKAELQVPSFTGFAVQDPETLRNAIEEALRNEAFLGAIATHLARLIEPSIKTALDTLEPVVETVYKQQLLLRKTNASVEDILLRLDPPVEPAQAPAREPVSEREDKSREEAVHQNASADKAAEADNEPSLRDVEMTMDGPETTIEKSQLDSQVTEIKQILEVNATQTTSSLSDLSKSLDANNRRIAEVMDSIAGLSVFLAPTTQNLEVLRASSEQATTTSSAMQAQLEQLKTEIESVIQAIPASLGANIESISQQLASQDTTQKLDAISASLTALESRPETKEALEIISTNLRDLKQISENEGNSSKESIQALVPQIESILSGLEVQSKALTDMKDLSPHHEILAAVQKSNDSHASHAAAFNEIKERNIVPSPISLPTPAATNEFSETVLNLEHLKSQLSTVQENFETSMASNNDKLADISTHIGDVLTTLEAHRQADSSAEILEGVRKANDLHEAHATNLEELKSLTNQSNDSHASHVATLEEIKVLATRSIDSNDSHAASLEEIKGLAGTANGSDTPYTAILEEIKSLATNSNDLQTSQASVLEEIKGLATSSNDLHTSHATTLEEIKGFNTRSILEPAPISESASPATLDAQIATIIGSLESHTATLTELKEDLGAEILTALHESNESHAAHRAALSEIKESDVSAEVLTALHNSNDSHAAHTQALGELQSSLAASNESHATHTTALDEIKATRSIEAAPVSDALVANDSIHAEKLEELLAAIKSQEVILTEIKAATSNVEVIEAIGKSQELLDSQSATLGSIKGQEATLTEIKAAISNLEVLEAIKQSEGLITAQGETLELIKAGIDNDAILTDLSSLKTLVEESKASVDLHSDSIKSLHEETKGSKSDLSSAIQELALGVAGGAAGGTVAGLVADESEVKSSAEILEEVKAVRASVEALSNTVKSIEESSALVSSSIGSNHDTITTSLATSFDTFKADLETSNSQFSDSLTKLSSEINDIGAAGLTEAIENCATTVKSLGQMVELLDGHFSITSSQVTQLVDGVSLSEKGLDQLKEHVVAIGGRGSSIIPRELAHDATVGESPVAADKVRAAEPVVEEKLDSVEEPAVEGPTVEEPVIEEELKAVEEHVEDSATEVPAAIENIEEAAGSPHVDEIAAEEPIEEVKAEELSAVEEPAAIEEPIEEPTTVDESSATEEPAVAGETKAEELPIVETIEEAKSENVDAEVEPHALETVEETPEPDHIVEEPLATEETPTAEEKPSEIPKEAHEATTSEEATPVDPDVPAETEPEEAKEIEKAPESIDEKTEESHVALEAEEKAEAKEPVSAEVHEIEPKTPETPSSPADVEAEAEAEAEDGEEGVTSPLTSEPSTPTTNGASKKKKGKKGKKGK